MEKMVFIMDNYSNYEISKKTFDLLKKEINNIDTSMSDLEEFKREMFKLKNRQSRHQLSDQRKLSDGFTLNDSVLDIEQGSFGLSYGDDVLYTYGIDPCCGVAVVDSEKQFLCHLDGKNQPSEVIELVNNLKFSNDAIVIIIPGGTCGIMPGTFNYKKLEKMFEDAGFEVSEQRIPATLGFVIVNSEQVTIGTALDQSLNISYSLQNGKVL